MLATINFIFLTANFTSPYTNLSTEYWARCIFACPEGIPKFVLSRACASFSCHHSHSGAWQSQVRTYYLLYVIACIPENQSMVAFSTDGAKEPVSPTTANSILGETRDLSTNHSLAHELTFTANYGSFINQDGKNATLPTFTTDAVRQESSESQSGGGKISTVRVNVNEHTGTESYNSSTSKVSNKASTISTSGDWPDDAFSGTVTVVVPKMRTTDLPSPFSSEQTGQVQTHSFPAVDYNDNGKITVGSAPASLDVLTTTLKANADSIHNQNSSTDMSTELHQYQQSYTTVPFSTSSEVEVIPANNKFSNESSTQPAITSDTQDLVDTSLMPAPIPTADPLVVPTDISTGSNTFIKQSTMHEVVTTLIGSTTSSTEGHTHKQILTKLPIKSDIVELSSAPPPIHRTRTNPTITTQMSISGRSETVSSVITSAIASLLSRAGTIADITAQPYAQSSTTPGTESLQTTIVVEDNSSPTSEKLPHFNTKPHELSSSMEHSSHSVTPSPHPLVTTFSTSAVHDTLSSAVPNNTPVDHTLTTIPVTNTPIQEGTYTMERLSEDQEQTTTYTEGNEINGIRSSITNELNIASTGIEIRLYTDNTELTRSTSMAAANLLIDNSEGPPEPSTDGEEELTTEPLGGTPGIYI